ncbi:zinc-dependent alcohol dehydrogenase [Halosimplex amylolyticum]|uniref:zinc-dependent alcohol dehydrogenase n=1 Tax=Halosimplex amylolyticum TaxID=3396616 RepID=UPI003F5674CE
MQRAVISGEREAGVVDAPDPDPHEDWVKIKVRAAPMCTEHKAFSEGTEQSYLGHEAAGEVVDVAQPNRFDVGDRVVATPLYSCGECWHCRSGEHLYCEDKLDVEAETGSREGEATYAQYHLKPDWLLAEIPDDVSYLHGSMACCGLGPTFGAMERMDVDAYDTVLVSGLGPVGLGGVINAAYRDAEVIGVEPTDYRADLARDLGADHVVDPTDDDALEQVIALTDGSGVDAAVDCSGIPAAQEFMIDTVRRRGQATFVADGGGVELDAGGDMVYNGLTIHGQWHYPEEHIPDVFQVIRDVPEKLDQFITHTYPLEDVQEAFETQATRECGKVVLDPWPDE